MVQAINDKGAVTFACPKCNTPITRTKNSRIISAKYTCKCGLTGPN